MTNPFKSTKDARQQLAEVPLHLCQIFQNTMALRGLIAEMELPIVQRALNAGPAGNDFWNSKQYIANITPVLNERHPAALAALGVLERSREFQEAEKLIAPILKALAALEAEEAAAALARAQAEAEHRDALAAAEVKALETARKDPLVVKAAQALRALIGA